MRSRKLLFLAVIAVAVLFGAGGFVLGDRLQSPEDARAEVAAPEASLIGVPVQAVALSNDVVVRGDAQFEGAVELELDATLGDGTARVVTGKVPAIDTEVNEGDILIEVSGRPVFVLAGALPPFRELKPGLEGDDVLQLEESLARLGYLTVEPDRLYGAATEEAIDAMYEDAGYDARGESEAQESTLEAARDAVEVARTNLADANDRLSDLLKPPSEVEQINEAMARQRLVDAVKDAQKSLADFRADRPTNSLLQAIAAAQDAELSGDPDLITSANLQVTAAQVGEEETEEAGLEGD